MDLIEINEAFAAQVIACDRELNMNPEKVNINGRRRDRPRPSARCNRRDLNHESRV
ncbi:hypothetical protein BDD39_001212 [Saccharococcus thermophilus]|uniref:Thiolase C-terminal domain-containing protein n=1 Tax=Saccharococcus thermophilus TaxID=29396 RepID=A0A846MDR2_9BACL|nr:hypothetical protein [Saccharococcus thermophilus]